MKSKVNYIFKNNANSSKAERLNLKEAILGWLENLKIEGAEAMSRMK